MKVIGLLILLGAIGFIFFGQEKNRNKLTAINLPDNFQQELPKSLGSVLGASTRLVEKYYPREMVEDAIRRAGSQVSSDAQEAVSGLTNSVVAAQFINTFKSLSPNVQKEVKGQICR